MADWRKDYVQYRRYFFDILSLYKRRQDIRAFMEILLSIGTIILFIAFAVRPTVITISQLLTELKNKEDTIAQMDTKIRNLQTAQTLLSQNINQLILLDTAIPTSPTPEVELRQFEGLAKKNGATILSLSSGEVVVAGTSVEQKPGPGQKPMPTGAKSFTISGTFTGDYASLFGLLSDIENLRRPVLMDSVSLSSIQTQAGKRVVLSISGRVPYILEINTGDVAAK